MHASFLISRTPRRSWSAAKSQEILGLITASEAYNLKNQNMTLEQGVTAAIETFRIADAAHIPFVLAMGMTMWCAYEGRIPESRILDLVGKFRNGGIKRYYFAGSLGMEDPRHVSSLFRQTLDRFPDVEVGFHVHNLSGNGPANIIAALDAGAMRALSEALVPLAGDPRLIAAWDFSIDQASDLARDLSAHQLHAKLHQMPTRAVTGANWDGRSQAWTEVPWQYGAIHFHSDDMADCGWSPDLTLRIPEDWRSGF
ncbi:MAG: hypothetical protein J0J14_09285, partial [Hyphomicrobium sp.]|nr:hypothetical protein [Hyphomicrobium sp.]